MTEEIRTKKCNQCSLEKELCEFNKNRKKCKDCRRDYNATMYQKNKDVLAVYHAKRYQTLKGLKTAKES